MKFAPWTVFPSLLPQGQEPSSSPALTVTLYGASVTAGHSWSARLRTTLYRHRLALCCAISAGAVYAVAASGNARLAGIVGAAAAAAGLAVSRPMLHVTDKMEAYVAEMVGAGDSTTIGGTVAEDLLDDQDRILTRSAVEWIQRARLHFGELRDTAADRICAKRWLAEEMKKADMRDKDACGLIPVVVEMLFVPTIDDVLAARLRRARTAGVMRSLVGSSPA